MSQTDITPPVHRGRPHRVQQRALADDILSAAEECLKTHSPRDVAMKDIARRANTNQAMINYYFGSKDGLLKAIVDRDMKLIERQIQEFRLRLSRAELKDPLRELVVLLTAAYYERPAMRQILQFELCRQESEIRAHYHGKSWNATRGIIAEVVRHGITTGRYRHNANLQGVVEILRSILFFPLHIQSYLVLVGSRQDFFVDPPWVDLVCEVMNDHLIERRRRRNANQTSGKLTRLSRSRR